ncbi:MAG: DUF421 domain-containing protein [Methanomicrobiaceae archaeon]|uniref:DUF421 domain-containing protein n=1 Tax=hydrocarbon metagenome TaxID=938273 RepID=A0A0W8FH70_9ZZZZ|nr:DUF421 domain-containing protein [Methanomicrobiaceae archaeon]MDD5418713.1 DUF421 domain-containing protein [Methanomicrobiaceae archaeon]
MSPLSDGMLFGGWEIIGRTIVVGLLAYVALVVIVRVSGKRTLSAMNAFDFIVTVALGSTLATILLSPNVALAEGIAAFVILIGLQFVVSGLSSRSRLVSRMVKNEPRMLYYRGEFLRDAMRGERVAENEILQALRAQGMASLDDVEAVILETNGNISIIGEVKPGEGSSLADVRGG